MADYALQIVGIIDDVIVGNQTQGCRCRLNGGVAVARETACVALDYAEVGTLQRLRHGKVTLRQLPADQIFDLTDLRMAGCRHAADAFASERADQHL